MLKLALLLVLFFFFTTQAVIYGTDERQEVVSIPAAMELSKSVAMMISDDVIISQPDNTFSLDFLPLSETFGLCTEQKFSQQYTTYVNCTGFLVAEDLILTAGHCMNHLPGIMKNTKTGFCDYFSWVFDYRTDLNGEVTLNNLSQEQVYRCKEIVYGELFSGRPDDSNVDRMPPGGEFGNDFAIVRLERKVKNRRPLVLAKNQAQKSEVVATIGHPSSLPAKYVTGAQVLETKYKNYFTTDLDIIGGNSGGPVFNKNNEVIGVVVRSFPGEDFIYDQKAQCSENFICKELGKGDCVASTENEILGSHIQVINELIKDILNQTISNE